jgi:hypothetical protein
MKKSLTIVLLISVCALALLYVKQRNRYLDLKQQRAAMRQEITDLKVLLNDMQPAAIPEAPEPIEPVAPAVRDHALQCELNGYAFRGMRPGSSERTYYRIEKISAVPDAETSPYKDCLVALQLRPEQVTRWRGTLAAVGDQVVTGLAWGFQDRVYGVVTEFETNQVVAAQMVAEENMDGTIRSLRMVDETDDPTADRYFLVGLEAAGVEPPQKVVVKTPESVPTREASIQASKDRIEKLLAAHEGDWTAWHEETRKYRDELQAKLNEQGGPLNHENRIFFLNAEPLDVRPNRAFPERQITIIKHLRDRLQENNIDLIVAPVPTKEVVNGCFFLDQPPPDHVLSPYRLQFFKRLLDEDIEVIDFLDPLIDALDVHPHVFYDATDSHPADGAIQVVARELGARLQRYRFPHEVSHVWTAQTRYRVKAKYFEPRSAEGFPYVATRIFDSAFSPLGEYAGDESPILMLTDSFGGVPSHYNVWSASVSPQIYKEIGVLPQKVQHNMGGPRVLPYFNVIGRETLDKKRVCVFLFGEFYLAFEQELGVEWVLPK